MICISKPANDLRRVAENERRQNAKILERQTDLSYRVANSTDKKHPAVAPPARFGGERRGRFAVAQLALLAELRLDGDLLEFAILPLEVDLEAAAGAEARHRTGRPGLRQCGQKVELAGVTLQEHLRDACRAAEVSVDLERRMRAEQVRVHARPVGGG